MDEKRLKAFEKGVADGYLLGKEAGEEILAEVRRLQAENARAHKQGQERMRERAAHLAGCPGLAADPPCPHDNGFECDAGSCFYLLAKEVHALSIEEPGDG